MCNVPPSFFISALWAQKAELGTQSLDVALQPITFPVDETYPGTDIIFSNLITSFSGQLHRVLLKKEQSQLSLLPDSLFPFSSKYLVAFSGAADSNSQELQLEFLIRGRSITELCLRHEARRQRLSFKVVIFWQFSLLFFSQDGCLSSKRLRDPS